MTHHHRQLAFAFVATVLARMLFHYLTDLTYDDAFITFRYADNIAAGHGFVYNEGQKVLGTTTPLFTLILSALAVLGIPVIKTALFVSLLSSGLTAVVLYQFARAVGFDRFSFVPVTIYVLFPRLLPTDTGGMETSLFTLLITAALFFQHKRLILHAVSAAALASVTRPEGLLLLGILVTYNVFREPKRLARLIHVPVLVILPWVLFAWFYFGSPIPNSVGAKLALYSRVWTMPLEENIVFLMGWHNPFGLLLFALALVGGWWLKRKQNFGLLEITWMVGVIASLALSSTHLFRWYVAPIYPIYILFAGASVLVLRDRVQWLTRQTDTAARLILAAMVVILVAANYQSVRYYRLEQNVLETIHGGIVRYLQTYADENDVVATEDIGYVGYYCGLKILDRAGLVSPEATPYNRNGDYLGLITDFRPDWVIVSPWDPTSAFLDSSQFVNEYRYRETFSSPETDSWEFLAFSRND